MYARVVGEPAPVELVPAAALICTSVGVPAAYHLVTAREFLNGPAALGAALAVPRKV